MERWTDEQVVLVLVVLGQIDEIVAIGWLVKFTFSIVIIVIVSHSSGPRMLCIKKS